MKDSNLLSLATEDLQSSPALQLRRCSMVSLTGFEPARSCDHHPLKVAGLPISPQGHGGERGIRTLGGFTHTGLANQLHRPLGHLSNIKWQGILLELPQPCLRPRIGAVLYTLSPHNGGGTRNRTLRALRQRVYSPSHLHSGLYLQ